MREADACTAALVLLLTGATSGCHRHGRTAEPSGPLIQITGDTVKVRRGQPPPARSALFDGTRVALRAARGETLGIEVLLYRTGPQAVSLALDAPGVTVQPFRVGFLAVREPSSGLYGRSTGAGDYPDILTPATGPVTSADQVFFDVAVSAGAAPGAVHGTLTAGDRRFPVTLRVEPVTIDVARAPLVWVWYSAPELWRAGGVAKDDVAGQIALERRYAALFRRHGALLASDFDLDALRARTGDMTPDVRYWPVAIAKHDAGKRADEVRAWIDFFKDRPQVPFAFTIDEPPASRRAEVRSDGLGIHAAGGGPGRFLYAVTDQARPIYKGAVDVFVSPRSIPPPDGYGGGKGTHFWTYNGKSPSAGNMTIDKPGTALRTWGWIAERYQVELWYAWEGLYYTDRYNRATAPTDVMHQPITYDERRKGGDEVGDGDGLLAYPGPLASLRLKALRRGLEDRLLLRALARCGAGAAAQAREIEKRMVPRALGQAEGDQAWPDSEVPWEEARDQVLDALEAHAVTCGAGAEAARAGGPAPHEPEHRP